MADLFDTLKNEFFEPLRKRATCTHAGESGPFCAQCGAPKITFRKVRKKRGASPNPD